MIWFNSKRGYNKYMEDPQKVQNKVDELTKSIPGSKWVPISGFVTLPDAEYKTRDEVKFNLDIGFVLKVFLNTTNGEAKLFSAKRFFKNE